MELTWRHEASPCWDADKRRVVGGAPAGVFDLSYGDEEPLPGDWWVAAAGDAVVGYGWLDATWGGDAEILLAVDASAQQGGVGSFVLSHLEDEAAARGMNYVYNTVRDTHPDRDDLHDWLAVRGYRGGTSDTTLRKRVGADRQREAVAPDPSTVRPAASRAASGGPPYDQAGESAGGPPYDPAGEGERAPGHEESGGYVDVEDHRY